jgi:hypothetical protein
MTWPYFMSRHVASAPAQLQGLTHIPGFSTRHARDMEMLRFVDGKVIGVDGRIRGAYLVPMPKSVGIGVLVDDTGLRPRTLQHWSDLGILKPEPSGFKRGRGFSHEYPAAPPSYEERSLALFAAALNDARMPLHTIKAATDFFRPLMTPNTPRALRQTPLGRALLGAFELMLVPIKRDEGFDWAAAKSAPSLAEFEDVQHWDLSTETERRTFTTYGNIPVTVPVDFARDFPAMLLLNLSKIFEPLVGRT